MARSPASERTVAAPDRLARRGEVRDALAAAGHLATPETLPLHAHRDELLAALAAHQVVVVAGETGSGKSTQLPKLALELGRGVAGLIGHTQPRRVAARTIAERVASELGVPVGGAVGFSVRFHDRVGDDTLVRVMTDGILLAELPRDRLLRRYDTLIVDEAHERSLNIDFICGYLKRLLPRRPDLKVIVTSATIDTARFAEHFAAGDGTPAPIVAIGGRTYPVEVRYRPLGEGREARDQVQAIVEAVEELAREGPGDVLVFLSGEREIHDAADALRRTDLAAGPLDVLPLYARLSSTEQHRIFEPGRAGRRRVVLSTNVAETSVTVPGIRYVVDAGTARISRYSRRLKVQRLPIEPISRASADQRAGRCGRVAPGVCVRLYGEDDYAARPEFTEPEVLRTNLASVILQMTAIGLGDVAAFPFVEPPDRAAIADGYRLLEELGAIGAPDAAGPRALTAVGRRLARLPVDPRLARMVLEGGARGCLREVLVIAAALSIRDPRERPADEREQADLAHRRFDVEGSDLLSIVALWDHLRECQRDRSANQFRRMCRAEYLNYLRVREWQDLYSQLRQAAGDLGLRPGAETSHPDHVHRAILSGLLSHLGTRDQRGRDYRGARGATFAIAPGSVLLRRAARRQPPAWVMAAELVETNRLWARRLAAVQPEWAEELGAHLVKRSYSEPRWSERGGRAVATETVTLYGLPIVTGRTVGYDRVDPATAHQMFVRHALVDGEWPAVDQYACVAHNRQFVADVAALEDRVRRRHLLDDHALEEFYAARVPAGVVSTRHFERWWRESDEAGRRRLELTIEDLPALAGADIRLDDYPDAWATAGDLAVELTYRFAPGQPLDGVTARLPLTALNQVAGEPFDWLVPGYRRELAHALARTLPKAIRRALIPIGESVDAALPQLGEPRGQITDALAGALRATAGVTVHGADFAPAALAPHLRMHFLVVDGEGVVHDAGDDLMAIRRRQAGPAREAVAGAVRAAGAFAERPGIVDWDVGTIPRVVETAHGGTVARGFPALLDDGATVSLRIFTSEELQRRVMRDGVRRLLALTAPPPLGEAARRLSPAGRLAVAASPISLSELAGDCRTAALAAVMGDRELPFDAEAFAALRRHARAEAPALAERAFAAAVDVLVAAARTRQALDRLTAPALAESGADAAAHLGRLVAPGFVTRAGVGRLGDVERFVLAVEHRLERLAGNGDRDRRRMAEVRPFEARYAAFLGRLGRAPVGAEVVDVGWLLEELRVSVFAQPLGTRVPVSPTRVGRRLTALGA